MKKVTFILPLLLYGIAVEFHQKCAAASTTEGTAPKEQPYQKPSDFNFSGWYVGSSAGYAQTHVKSTDAFQTNYNISGLNGVVSETSLSGRNARGGLYGGCGVQQQALYFGLEAETTLQNIKSNQSVNFSSYSHGIRSIHNISVTLKNGYSFSVKGGYVFNSENLLYVKIGALYSNWSISSVYPQYIGSKTVTIPAYTAQKRQFGFQLVTGFEKAVTKNVIAGAEVTYGFYKKNILYSPTYEQQFNYTICFCV
jgi:opacity protein-like surface antigen